MARRTPDTLDCASAQWIGKRREQEDVVKSLSVDGGMLGIVCDGMGGHLRGACASCVVADAFASAFAESGQQEIPARLAEALHAGNEALAATQRNLKNPEPPYWPHSSGTAACGGSVWGIPPFTCGAARTGPAWTASMKTIP